MTNLRGAEHLLILPFTCGKPSSKYFRNTKYILIKGMT